MSDELLHRTHPEVVRRLRRAEGHLRSTIVMIETGRPCVELAQKLHAVEKAIAEAKRSRLQRWFVSGARLPSARLRPPQDQGKSNDKLKRPRQGLPEKVDPKHAAMHDRLGSWNTRSGRVTPTSTLRHTDAAAGLCTASASVLKETAVEALARQSVSGARQLDHRVRLPDADSSVAKRPRTQSRRCQPEIFELRSRGGAQVFTAHLRRRRQLPFTEDHPQSASRQPRGRRRPGRTAADHQRVGTRCGHALMQPTA
jgi:Metal-sensitive transcriptional repressor